MEETGDPIAFRQRQYTQAYEAAKRKGKSLESRAAARRTLAYLLKGLSIFGGLAITYGLPDQWPKIVGLLISGCVATDAWLSNHKRLLGLTEAAHAYSRLCSAVTNRHTLELGPILDLNRNSNPEASTKLAALFQLLLKELQDGTTKIDDLLRILDLEALRSLKPERVEETATGVEG